MDNHAVKPSAGRRQAAARGGLPRPIASITLIASALAAALAPGAAAFHRDDLPLVAGGRSLPAGPRSSSRAAGTTSYWPVGARGQVGTHRQVGIADTLIGVYIPVSESLGMRGATTPSGEEDCPCYWYAMTGGQAAGAGDYTMQLSGAGAWRTGGEAVHLGGADAKLPS